MKRVSAVIAAETRAYGVGLCLSPVAEPAREPVLFLRHKSLIFTAMGKS
jgi:beta-glucosidase-like glycosyl hydrolase